MLLLIFQFAFFGFRTSSHEKFEIKLVTTSLILQTSNVKDKTINYFN